MIVNCYNYGAIKKEIISFPSSITFTLSGLNLEIENTGAERIGINVFPLWEMISN